LVIHFLTKRINDPLAPQLAHIGILQWILWERVYTISAFNTNYSIVSASTKFKAMWHAVDASAATNTLIEQSELTTDGTRNVDFADSQSAMVCGNLSGGNLRERQFGSDSEFQCQVVVDG
jgi:hypothetical protein